MKKLLYMASAIALVACGSSKETANTDNDVTTDQAAKYAKTITAKDLGKHLFIYASDEFEGRNTGEPGQKKAVKYLKDFYVSQGIASPLGGDDYFQEVPSEYLSNNRRGMTLKDSENVVAFIKGTEKPDEIVVISAHLDHEGVKNGEIYNGADDDGSGTVAILEIAEAFKQAADAGKGPKRSILFLHVTGEEKGLLGSKYYTENPIFPLANTVADLNIDMIGRVDDRHKGNPNYVYLIGSDKLSTELHDISEAMNKKYTNIDLDYKYNDDNDPNRFYYRSDHYNFAKHNIPIIFYFNGTHADYHRPTDTPDKINYEMLENRARLVFHTAWEVANRENRVVVDKAAE
ncbi:M28 family metallopeptidase [Tenacibaculum sp. 1B UA]|uniref:M28 family metallopeptidase n=1 Tax=unclassified Tenacibaculum TaxID=2635139 RepID=UPI0026E202BC|nr:MULTISPECIES: M28 family metallopeptidase [unclassified Tenacibaculum]MDO6674630.1 M28 family metallopeptidase [Tenacibaculum sp. 1_MG-2023]MDX8553366.1 M28 family metallopeptidase [Tenacibaculum sp. 1B UA]